MLAVVLACGAILLVLAPIAVAIGSGRVASRLVYGASLAASAASLVAAVAHLLAVPPPEAVVLPLGIPRLGAHFRLRGIDDFIQDAFNKRL